MRKSVIAFLALIASLPAVAGQAEPVAAIPLKDCSSEAVMLRAIEIAHEQYAQAAAANLPSIEKVKGLANKYKNAGRPGQPLLELLTPEETLEFSTASAQLWTGNLNAAAASRLMRDMQVLLQMYKVAQKARADANYAPPEGSPDYKPFSYLVTLRETYKGASEHPGVKNRDECSLHLALQREPKLSAVMSDLRYFADIMQWEYEGLKTDISRLGGSEDWASYEAAYKERYQALEPKAQQTDDLWRLMNEEIPSEFARGTKRAAARSK